MCLSSRYAHETASPHHSLSPAEVLVHHQALHRCSAWWPIYRCAGGVGAGLSGSLKPKRSLGNAKEKRFGVLITPICIRNRFCSPFLKPGLGFSAPDRAAPTHRCIDFSVLMGLSMVSASRDLKDVTKATHHPFHIITQTYCSTFVYRATCHDMQYLDLKCAPFVLNKK